MITIKLQVNSRNIIGVKETLAAYLERFGDVRVISVVDDATKSQGKQMDMFGAKKKT